MLLLTTGPRLFYVDPVNMVLKGEIPWSPELRVEAKNFRIFLVYTVSYKKIFLIPLQFCRSERRVINIVLILLQPNRTYYLEDPQSYALEWTRVIDEVRIGTYGRDTTQARARRRAESRPPGCAPAFLPFSARRVHTSRIKLGFISSTKIIQRKLHMTMKHSCPENKNW